MTVMKITNQITLEIAKCCGTCAGANHKARPQPQDHAPHYMIAKTERWCQKHSIPTVREAVCPDWELEPKKGGVPAVKRALRQNLRLQAILKLKEQLYNDKVLVWEGYRFEIEKDYVVYSRWISDSNGYTHRISCKESRFDRLLRQRRENF